MDTFKEFMSKKHEGAGFILLTPDKKVLLLQKPNLKWSFPGGHRNKGETPIETARRETYEETGIDVTPTKIERFIHTSVTGLPCFSFIINVKNEIQPRLSAEHINYGWFSKKELNPLNLTRAAKIIYVKFLNKHL